MLFVCVPAKQNLFSSFSHQYQINGAAGGRSEGFTVRHMEELNLV